MYVKRLVTQVFSSRLYQSNSQCWYDNYYGGTHTVIGPDGEMLTSISEYPASAAQLITALDARACLDNISRWGGRKPCFIQDA